MKFKDYYDIEYIDFLTDKIKEVYRDFNVYEFNQLVEPTLTELEFNDRQELIASSLKQTIPLSYSDSINIFSQILGPELESSLGMFSEGYWLWPIGKFVEMYGADEFDVSTEFSKELTKRFTGEFCMRPIIKNNPDKSMELLLKWSRNENKRVRRLASECIRIRLPWAKKMYVALEYFDVYYNILSNLKDDEDKTIQKSVANNLNDLYKEDSIKFDEIVSNWLKNNPTKECLWVIKHGSRTKNKKT